MQMRTVERESPCKVPHSGMVTKTEFMKSTRKKSALLLLLFAFVALSSCKKDNGDASSYGKGKKIKYTITLTTWKVQTTLGSRYQM